MVPGPVIKQTSAIGGCAFTFTGKECIIGIVASARQKGQDSGSVIAFSTTGAIDSHRLRGRRCIQDANLTKPVCDFMFDSLSRGLGISRIPRVPVAAQCAP